MKPLDVRVLGALSISHDGQTASESSLGGRRGAVVVARLLSARPDALHREHLAAALWGEQLPTSWRSSLRNLIADVRRGIATLGADVDTILTTRDHGYAMHLPAGSHVDLDELFTASTNVEDLMQRGDARGALEQTQRSAALAELPVLEGIDTPFTRELRQRVHSAGVRMRLASGRTALVAGRADLAETHAQQVLASSPYREDAHRLLIEALNAMGNRASALRAYEECRRLLADDLGVTPSAQTQAVFHELLAEDEVEPPAAEPAWSLLLGQRTPHFVGRTLEIADLSAAWDEAESQRSLQVVDVVGESGIGKTMLAAEFTARTRDAGAAVLYGRAADRLGVPFRPILEAIDSYLATLGPARRAKVLGQDATALARFLPTAREIASPSRGHGLPELEQMHLFEAIGNVLTRLASTSGVLVVLDDMQWSDPVIGELITHLHETTAVPLLLLSLRRPPRAEPAASWPRAVQLPLGPLSVEDVANLSSRLGGGNSLSEAKALWEESGGNALYATERLQLRRLAHATPTPHPASAPAADGIEDDLPPRLLAVVRERIAALPPTARTVLETAAVVGLEFDPETVLEASDVPHERATVALAIAERDGILTAATAHPRWRAFRHALIRNALLADLDPTRAMQLHREVGYLQETDAPTLRSSIPDLAHHFSAAAPLGDWQRAVRYHLQVARSAMDHLVLGDAIIATELALQVLSDAGGPDEQMRVELLITQASAHRLRGDQESAELLDSAYAAALALGSAELIARAALAYSISSQGGDELFLDMGRIDTYRDALDRLPPTEHELRARLLGCLASGYSWTLDAKESAQLIAEATALAQEVGDLATLSTVLTNRRRTQTGSGRSTESRDLEGQLFSIAAELGDPLLLGRTWMWRFETAVELALRDDVDSALSTARPLIERHGPPPDRWSLRYYSSALSLLRGEIERADQQCEQAAEFGRDSGMAAMPVEGLRLIQLMGIRHEQGRLAELRDELVEFFDAAGVAEWRTANAFVDAELGRLDLVTPILDEVIDGYRTSGARVAVGIGLAAHVATPVARTRNIDMASFLYDLLKPYAGQGGFVAYFTGPIDWALGLCAETCSEHKLARWHFARGARLAAQLGAPRWEHRCRAAAEDGAGAGLDWRP